MNKKVFDDKFTLEQLRQNLVMLNAEEIEIPRKWILELIIMAQKSEHQEELLLKIRNDSKLWRIAKASGCDQYAGSPPFVRLIDEVLKY
jgi:hypothetical protein